MCKGQQIGDLFEASTRPRSPLPTFGPLLDIPPTREDHPPFPRSPYCIASSFLQLHPRIFSFRHLSGSGAFFRAISIARKRRWRGESVEGEKMHDVHERGKMHEKVREKYI